MLPLPATPKEATGNKKKPFMVDDTEKVSIMEGGGSAARPPLDEVETPTRRTRQRKSRSTGGSAG